MQHDDFVSMQKEKAAEQTNVTQKVKKKKEPIFGPHAKRSHKFFWKVHILAKKGDNGNRRHYHDSLLKLRLFIKIFCLSKTKTNFMAPLEPLCGGSLLFTPKFSEIRG